MRVRSEAHTLAIANVRVFLSLGVLNLENAACSCTIVVRVGGHGEGIIAGRALFMRVGDEHASGEVVSQEHTVSGLESAVSSVSKRNLYSKILEMAFLTL